MFKKYQKILHLIILIAFLYSTFLLGRLGYIFQLNLSKPNIVSIPEINQKVCRVFIESFDNKKIRGQVNKLDIRFSYKDNIYLTDEAGYFEITK